MMFHIVLFGQLEENVYHFCFQVLYVLVLIFRGVWMAIMFFVWICCSSPYREGNVSDDVHFRSGSFGQIIFVGGLVFGVLGWDAYRSEWFGLVCGRSHGGTCMSLEHSM